MGALRGLRAADHRREAHRGAGRQVHRGVGRTEAGHRDRREAVGWVCCSQDVPLCIGSSDGVIPDASTRENAAGGNGHAT